jgi:hypothetical protein
MISYELAQQLKDAGFPKDGFEFQEAIPDVKVNEELSITGDPARWRNIPTLTELIEACKPEATDERYFQLEMPMMGWIAYSGLPEKDGNADRVKSSGYCSTPEEAVAKLWLTLNKK